MIVHGQSLRCCARCARLLYSGSSWKRKRLCTLHSRLCQAGDRAALQMIAGCHSSAVQLSLSEYCADSAVPLRHSAAALPPDHGFRWRWQRRPSAHCVKLRWSTRPEPAAVLAKVEIIPVPAERICVSSGPVLPTMLPTVGPMVGSACQLGYKIQTKLLRSFKRAEYGEQQAGPLHIPSVMSHNLCVQYCRLPPTISQLGAALGSMVLQITPCMIQMICSLQRRRAGGRLRLDSLEGPGSLSGSARLFACKLLANC
jgi:hypothetical protein